MTFADGTREPLHGHNYRLRFRGHGASLKDDMVFDFLHIKPVIKKLCDGLDHRFLLPERNPHLTLGEDRDNITIATSNGTFSIPKSDVVFLPIVNTSVERIGEYLIKEIRDGVWKSHGFAFHSMEVEVEESFGQSALCSWSESA